MTRILHHTPLAFGREPEPLSLPVKHWRAHRDAEHNLWLVLDQQGSDTNTLSRAVLEELDTLLDEAERLEPRALVVRSAKSDNFAVGADIEELQGLGDEAGVRDLLDRAHAVVNRLAQWPKPTVAVIHGNCLGGGLELALACDLRIARSDASLGFPEVQLGLHPGLGGTARLTRVVSPDQALTLMLTGKPAPAAKARSLGLVDAVTEERHVEAAVADAVRGRLESRAGGARVTGMNLGPARKLVVRQARKETERHARPEHYPAPYRLLDLYDEHGDSASHMLEHEAGSFAGLLASDTAKNLMRVYFLREGLRRRGKRHEHGIRHVHVIGAGTMGGDIAAWCAHQGITATVEDMEAERIAPAVARAASLFRHKHKHDPAEARRAADRLIPDPGAHGRARADLIIEAVPEKLELKREIFGELERQARDDAILATNTSGILLEDIRTVLERPERLIGMHFFNPVSRMPLVELVCQDQLDTAVLDRLAALTVAIGRLPVPVKSAPGFLVNRILTPYLLEAVTLVDEGVPAERVDAAAEAFGMPVGPVALADQVGLDIALDVADGLHDKLDTPLPEVPDWLRRKVEQGEVGAKAGKGMYDYEDGEPQKKSVDQAPDDDLVDRLMLPMVNTAVTCLGEGVVDDAESLDGAVIFGTGFAPFRGGPLAYARSRGSEELRERLEALAERLGPRFAPSPAWQQVFSGQ